MVKYNVGQKQQVYDTGYCDDNRLPAPPKHNGVTDGVLSQFSDKIIKPLN